MNEQLEIPFEHGATISLPPILTLREFIAQLEGDGFPVKELRAIYGSIGERSDE